MYTSLKNEIINKSIVQNELKKYQTFVIKKVR